MSATLTKPGPAPAPVNSSCWPVCRGELRPAKDSAGLECPRCGELSVILTADNGRLPFDPDSDPDAV